MDVRHTALEVEDLGATRRFYEELLGLEHSRDYESRGIRNYYVSGRGSAELQFRVVDGPVEPSGINHVALAVDDVDETVRRATEEFGFTVEQEPRSLDRVNRRLAVLSDPTGYAVHLIEDLE